MIFIPAFALGVWLLQQQADLPALYWALCLFPLPLLVYGLRSNQQNPIRFLRLALSTIFVFGLGLFWAAGFAHIRLSAQLPEHLEGRDLAISGVIVSLPARTERGLKFNFEVDEASKPSEHFPSRIQLSWFDSGFSGKAPLYPMPALHPGERWQLTVRLKRPHGNANPGGFDYEAWLLENNIRATGYVREGLGNRLTGSVIRFDTLVELARERVLSRIQKVLGDRPFSGVIQALAVGEQRAIPASQWQVFQRTGVNHLMSISGIHVTMLSGLVYALAFGLWRRSTRLSLRLPAHKLAALAGALTALAYAWLSGYGIPTQRTLYMLAIVALALWTGRAGNVLAVLNLALLAVLLLDPWAVMSAGFWLSFGAVAAILLVSTGRIGRLSWLMEWGRVQWAVTLGLIPLLLALFQQISLVSPVANAVAIPLISLVVTPLSLLGALLPFDFLLLAAQWTMSLGMLFLEWLSALPVAVWEQHAPPGWAIGLAIVGVIWLLMPRGFPARWLGLIWFAPVFLVLPATPKQGELWVEVLDVGQGLAAVIRTQHHALLYDTGSHFGMESDAGSRIVIPYLRASGVRHLDGMIVSHDDIDHSGGALSVLQSFSVSWLASSLPAANPVKTAIDSSPQCFAGQVWEWDSVRFEMLHPTLESYAFPFKDNNRSCVLKVTSRFGSILLTGDIEAQSEVELLRRVADKLPTDILLVPHHGSLTSSTLEFIQAVHPNAAIFTAGYHNRFGHPREEVLERYRLQGVTLWRTDRQGALDVRFNSTGTSLTGQRQSLRRYWHASE
ncbi:MAG: DNA internalization-related competence protein ComEC/Rec2 [Sulfuricellaceae bacterium]|nr:DNA internalization-related competence protein ComEC/Rec2 [Sulfuricellaceae bacterium]